MSDASPVLISLGRPNLATALREALSGARAIVLDATDARETPRGMARFLPGLLRHPMPVTGAAAGRIAGEATTLLLACDRLVLAPRTVMTFVPSGRGEVVLLALRLGHREASRVWFSGGALGAASAARSGWSETVSGGREAALDRACHRYDGLSPSALALLRPLLFRQSGLPLGAALALERAAFSLAFETGHPAEGVAAFLEKRKPRFEKKF